MRERIEERRREKEKEKKNDGKRDEEGRKVTAHGAARFVNTSKRHHGVMEIFTMWRNALYPVLVLPSMKR